MTTSRIDEVAKMLSSLKAENAPVDDPRVKAAVAEFVAFASWRCNCTLLAKTLSEIPALCPTHKAGLLLGRSWEQNPNRVPFGLRVDHRRQYETLLGVEVES